MIDFAAIESARARLAGVVRPTPTVASGSLANLLGRPVHLKPEHLQRTGSFKIRGAYNCISRIAEATPDARIVAASAGNHAQGVALAARLCHVGATIFMPTNAALPKVAATRADGATVILGGTSVDDCIARARAFADAEGAVFVPPFDDPRIVAGQGTVGLEIAEEAPELDAVLVPIGGGGLIAGIACAIRELAPTTRVVGVEAAGAASMAAARAAGHPVALERTSTMADGIAVREVSTLTLDHVRAQVDQLVTVDEESISQAAVLLLERHKWVVEPAGAVGVAALLSGAVDGTGPIGVVLSGGNVDPLVLTRLVDHGLTSSGRYLQLRVVLDDRPGTLAALTAAIAASDLNVLAVDHHRSGTGVGVFEVEVLLTLETRDPDHREEVVTRLRAAGFPAEIRS